MLSEWHDFFIVLGAAAGTLIGAMFVVVSIASGLIKGSELTSRIFVTPTIVHLAVVLMSCAFMLVPSLNHVDSRRGAGVAGIVFLGYAGRNVFHISRRRAVEWSDHLWYGICAADRLSLDRRRRDADARSDARCSRDHCRRAGAAHHRPGSATRGI